jgi:hypothetical protein
MVVIFTSPTVTSIPNVFLIIANAIIQVTSINNKDEESPKDKIASQEKSAGENKSAVNKKYAPKESFARKSQSMVITITAVVCFLQIILYNFSNTEYT